MSTSPQTFSTESSSQSQQHSLPLILTLVLLVLFFLGFFSIYFCRYITNVAWIHRHQPNAANQPLHSGNSPHTNGLHPSIVASFPTFTYALVKEHRRGKCGLECAVCLSEFSDNDVLRLLTVCSHAFHPNCIDLWFESHTTCPVCRRNLDLAEKVPEVRIPMPESEVVVREEAVEREVQEQAAAAGGGESWQRISFKEEEEEERRGERATETASEGRQREHVATMEWLPRSHSTGHSIVEDERFTLSLPENVKERKWKGSCITFGELSNELGGGGVVVDQDQRKDEVMMVDFSTSTSQSQSHSHPPPDDLTHHACHSILV